jgi:hypothetical protein
MHYKGEDTLFTVIRVLTMLTFLVWPLIFFLTIMAFGGSDKSAGLHIKLIYAAALSYPWIFMAIVNFAEVKLVSYSYGLAAAVAILPVLLTTAGAFFLGRSL